jgi:hypothetical protein
LSAERRHRGRTLHHALEHDVGLERRDTMKAITELTIAAAAVALLVAAAVQINRAQASAPIPVAQDVHGTSAAGVTMTPIGRRP